MQTNISKLFKIKTKTSRTTIFLIYLVGAVKVDGGDNDRERDEKENDRVLSQMSKRESEEVK